MSASVIIPLDTSQTSHAALCPGRALAVQLGLPLRLISIVAEPAECAAREAELRAFADSQELADAEIEIVVNVESPAAGIISTLREPESRLVMSTHARGTVAHAMLGSVTRVVVREAQRPVFLVGPQMPSECTSPLKTVLVCLDGSPLSEAMLPAAVSLVKAIGGELRLIQVIKPELGARRRGGPPGDWNYLRRVADHLPERFGIAANWDVLHGKDVAEAVVSYAAVIQGAVIAMTTHGRSDLQRAVLGSFARDVVSLARNPVVVLRPAPGEGEPSGRG